jgi:purine nucleosidase
MTTEPVRLLIDTDTAGDDVFSLLLALRDPRARLEAVTIVCGNVRFDQQVENALYTIEQAGRAGEVPVYAGCGSPLIAEWVGAEYVHGQDGMGDSGFPRAAQRREPAHAVDELVRRVDESPGELTILAQGPLTNLALAVARDPDLPAKVRHVYVMGGGVGNITPAAEFNFYVDPEAAKIVLGAGFPLTLFTWTLTRSHGVFGDDKLARIEALGTPLSRFFGQVNRKALEFDRDVAGIPGSTHPDSMTCAAILDPSLILAAEDAVVDVETSGELTRGWNLIDTLGRTGRDPNARVVTDYDTDRFFDMLLEVLR